MSSESHKCGKCGDVFDTKAGLSMHQTHSHNEKKWRDENWLREEYVEEGKTAAQIADEQDTTTKSVTNYLDKHDIKQRSASERTKSYWQKQPVSFYTATQGAYEMWKDAYDGEQQRIQHHRLLAVAEYGIDAVEGSEVHHKNGIPWDNRPENIELLTKIDHAKRHEDERIQMDSRTVSAEECSEFREQYPDKTQVEIAEEYGYTGQTVWRHVNRRCRH